MNFCSNGLCGTVTYGDEIERDDVLTGSFDNVDGVVAGLIFVVDSGIYGFPSCNFAGQCGWRVFSFKIRP